MHGIWFWVFMSSQWHCSRVWYLHPQYTHINTHSTISTHNTYIILTFTCTCMHFLKSDLKLKYQFPSARRGWTCFIQVFFFRKGLHICENPHRTLVLDIEKGQEWKNHPPFPINLSPNTYQKSHSLPCFSNLPYVILSESSGEDTIHIMQDKF